MDALHEFTIPIMGLHHGNHQYEFKVDDDFFSAIEESAIEQGKFDVKVNIDIREDMIVFTFDFKGSIKTDCDRCLANIDLPIEGVQDLIVKYALEENDIGEVIYILRETSELNIAKFIYESICLGMPVANIYDCEDEPENVCDLKMLDYLENKNKPASENKSDDSSNSPWDALKDFK